MPDDQSQNKDQQYQELVDHLSALGDRVRELERAAERAGAVRSVVSRLEMEFALLSQTVQQVVDRVGRMEHEWQQARAGMSVIWGRIKDAVSLNIDRQKVTERTVRQLTRIVNRLSSSNIIRTQDTGKLSMAARRAWLVAIAKLMEDVFSEDDLIAVAFDTSLDHEALDGGTKQKLIREMVLYFFRNNQMDVLLSVLARERPGVVWPMSPEDIVMDFDPDTAWRDYYE